MLTTKVKPEQNWNKVARLFAQDAHENHFSSRRGIWHLEDEDKLCIYNNNPYANSPDLRKEETAEFRAWLKAKGIKELAYATFGENGYTYAMILDAGGHREAEVFAELDRIVRDSWARMK